MAKKPKRKSRLGIYVAAVPYVCFSLVGMAIGIVFGPVLVGIRAGSKMAEDIGEAAMEAVGEIYNIKYKREDR